MLLSRPLVACFDVVDSGRIGEVGRDYGGVVGEDECSATGRCTRNNALVDGSVTKICLWDTAEVGRQESWSVCGCYKCQLRSPVVLLS